MVAICYLGDYNARVIPGRSITRDPLATCAICGVLSCDGHGKRDPNVRRFECVLCVPALLVVAAIQQSGTAQFREDFPVTEAERPFMVRSVDDLVRSWPEFASMLTQNELAAFAEPRNYNAQLLPLWNSLLPEGHQLIEAAMVIAEHLELRPQDLPTILVSFMQRKYSEIL